MRASRPTLSVERRIEDGVADKAAHNAEPSRWSLSRASADRAGRFDHVIVGHSYLLSSFTVPHPGSPTAATERNQPCVPVAAVIISEPARALPPTPSSLGASRLAEASQGASAFSSVIRRGGRVRDAVAAVGFASVATADRDSMNATTLRVIAASSIADISKSISARA